ncbi:hypothetical protein [Streptomyces angustmyceticus]|uniref:hypothetical protein n=1 Tax=Streptomyces angustmyceticus TaxID=285578 RepID=UPI00117F281F|nr:hypothetical protein [Streptomyces angustmyceticus]UAL65230.1 hypothetical protein K7396_00750 [Streptomyces angustmyceticus]
MSHGAFNFGSHSAVVSPVSGAFLDEEARVLVLALRELRADLARVRPTADVVALATELELVQAEIAGTGSVTSRRLARLWEAIAEAHTVVGVLASGAAFVEAMERLGALSQRPPTGHTPPGPSTSSDDDEWPEPE